MVLVRSPNFENKLLSVNFFLCIRKFLYKKKTIVPYDVLVIFDIVQEIRLTFNTKKRVLYIHP